VSHYDAYDDVNQLLGYQTEGIAAAKDKGRNYDDSFEARGGRVQMSDVPLKGQTLGATVVHRLAGAQALGVHPTRVGQNSIRRSRSHSTELMPRALAAGMPRSRGLSNPVERVPEHGEDNDCICRSVDSSKARLDLEEGYHSQQHGGRRVAGAITREVSSPHASSCTVS
jgi:hypothetical protein